MSKTSATTWTFPVPLSLIGAKSIACFAGKLAGGCLTLIAIVYFWALMKDLTPEIGGWFFGIPQMVSMLSLAFYLAVNFAILVGVRVSAGTAKAAQVICVIGPWICLVPIFAYLVFELFRGAGNEILAALILTPTAFAAIAVTRRWAKTKPYLAGNLLLLLGAFCAVIGIAVMFAIGIIIAIAMIPFILAFCLLLIPVCARAI